MDIPILAQEAALWWAGNWKIPSISSRSERVAPMVPNGGERFDELIFTFGSELERLCFDKSWRNFERTLAVFSDELRFKIFEQRDDAVHAALESAKVILSEGAEYHCINWNLFDSEFEDILRTPSEITKELSKCIRKHFRRPQQ